MKKNVEQHLEWAIMIIFVNYADHDWTRILFVEVRRRLVRQRYVDNEELCSRDWGGGRYYGRNMPTAATSYQIC